MPARQRKAKKIAMDWVRTEAMAHSDSESTKTNETDENPSELSFPSYSDTTANNTATASQAISSKNTSRDCDDEDVDEDDEKKLRKADLECRFKFDAGIWEDHAHAIYGCSFSPYIRHEAPVFASAASNRVSIYSCPPSSGGGIQTLQCYKDPEKSEEFYCVTWLYDEESERHILAAAGLRAVIRIFSPMQGICSAALIGHGHSVNELRTHPNHSMILLSASQDYTVRLWNIKLETCIAIIGGGEGHKDQVLSADFNLTGSQIVTCSMDHSVKIWTCNKMDYVRSSIDDTIQQSLRLETKKRHGQSFKLPMPLQLVFPTGSTTDLHRNYIDCVRFCGSQFILSKACDETLCLWKFGELDEETGDVCLPGGKLETNVSLLRTLEIPDSEIWFLKFAIDPQFKMVAAGNKTGKIYVWPISEEMDEVQPIVLSHARCKRTIRQLDFSPDGRVLIAVCDDATIWRWTVIPK